MRRLSFLLCSCWLPWVGSIAWLEDSEEENSACLLQLTAGRHAKQPLPSASGQGARRHLQLASSDRDITGVRQHTGQHAPIIPFTTSNTSPEATRLLQANQPWVINAVICGIVGTVACLTTLGAWLGGQHWVAAMVGASYAILIPGLFTKDFSFNIALVVSGLPIVPDTRYQITAPRRIPGPIRESTRSLVPLLWESGSKSGAILIAIFAFVVPITKLLLLGVGELWRHRPEVWKVRTARACIVVVQIISKWASPDMFAFALLYYLLRSLHHPPFLESIQVLDVGFACYNVFCVSSVISTMCIRLPQVPDAKEGSAEVGLVQRVSRLIAAPVAAALFAAWAVVFFKGITAPVLSMRLDVPTILGKLQVPPVLENVVSMLRLEDIVAQDVSIKHAAATLWAWYAESGELNLLLATVMLGIFGILLTVVDMVLLLALAFGETWGAWCTVKKPTASEGGAADLHPGGGLLRVTEVLKHLAMLDVCTAGVVVVSFAASIYQEQGIVIERMWGLWYTLLSEVLHYLTFYFVTLACHRGASPKA